MRVGVYVDGFNLYYGARQLCGRGTPGWRWLDLGSLATRLVAARKDWPSARIERVVYCTAIIDRATNPPSHADQQTYLKALRASGSTDEIAYGHYVSRVKYAPLAIRDSSRRPVLVRPGWPVTIQDAAGNAVPDATFIIWVRLLWRDAGVCPSELRHGDTESTETHGGHRIGRAPASNEMVGRLRTIMREPVESPARNSPFVFVSSVSPCFQLTRTDRTVPQESRTLIISYRDREARKLVPVGTVNPSPAHLANDLRGTPNDGVGCHWWYRLTATDCCACQLPDPVPGSATTHPRPSGW
jgi:hypothetical protein